MMTNQQEIIDQHFLPQCYLNGFVNKSDILYTLDLKLFLDRGKKPYARESTPAKICKDEHFYTVDENAQEYNLGSITDKYLVEKSFHVYENVFQDLIKKVCSGNPLTIIDASSLLRIIVDLKFRNKYFRDNLIAPRKSEVINEAFEEIQKSFDHDPEFRAKYAELTQVEMAELNRVVRSKLLNDPNFKKNAHLSSLVNRDDGYEALMNSLIPKLLKCRWVVLKSDNQFISNDNPGCSMDSATNLHNSYFERGFLFAIPLTSSYCLTISDALEDQFFIANPAIKQYPIVEAPKEMIEMSNSFAVRHFNKIAFGPDKELLNELSKSLVIKK